MKAPALTPRTTVAGALVTRARLRSRLSQRALAAKVGVAQSTIARIESGTANPSFSTVERILAAVDLEMRIQIEPIDDHDRVLQALDALRAPEERASLAVAHQRNVAKFVEGGRRTGPHR